jgi:hypothetical protein
VDCELLAGLRHDNMDGWAGECGWIYCDVLGQRVRLRLNTYFYRCPVCKKSFESNSPNEPCCTGTSESRDDHEMTVMLLERVNTDYFNPIKAEKRAKSGFIVLPDHPDFLHR